MIKQRTHVLWRRACGLSLLSMGLAALAMPVRANYRTKAEAATDYIQRAFYDEKAGLYRPSAPLDPKALPYDFMWANGVQFSALVGAARANPTKYRPVLQAFTRGLEKYWDAGNANPGFDAYFSSPTDDDKYYDDNQWLVLGFTEAYRFTRDPKYLDWARRTHNFVLTGYDEKLGGGIYWYQKTRDSKNTCSNAPAAASALELYNIERKPADLDMAKRLYSWTCTNLQDKDGLFWDNIKLDGTIERTKWTYNTALMIRSALGLWRATKDAKYLQEARRMADASIVYWANPQTGAFRDSAKFNHLLSEALILVFEATKDIKYLNAVRRDADFAYRHVRDVQNGGYWNDWVEKNHAPDERKTLIENSSVARLFWLLVPYADVEELRAQAEAAARKGDTKTALNLLRQALDSTAGAPAGKEIKPTA
ncbi:MAG: hypothetical protein JWN98_1676 [Abditibacteriota bacterium]|nr:hypothetical protein [Abditibacteriota bacterium]